MLSTHRCIAVRAAAEQYDIHIGLGLLSEVGEHVVSLTPGRKAFVMSHPGLYDLYGAPLTTSLRQAGFAVTPCMVPEGERSKSLSVASRLFTRLAHYGADRHSLICALGGGVIGDLSGFVAATYMRGVPFVQIPTSLLAMVDSSIGGKTGVDHRLGKNLIGAFYSPRAVFTDTALLQSLPEREYLCGLSEIVKAGVICDAELFAFIETHIEAVRQRDAEVLNTLVERAIAVKVNVVQQDPTERGLRAILNFGHTIGQALETVTAYAQYSHGEAVAIGMALVALLSERLGCCKAEARARLHALLEALHLPMTYTNVQPQHLLTAMTHDKKSLNGVVRFVLMEDIGAVVFNREVPLDTLAALLQQQG
ncbi:MAG TPA: 3-dehydroquinate synthase [Candidatus Tectomicrobia bacterium]|jgi:3-dehydroquinate synthase